MTGLSERGSRPDGRKSRLTGKEAIERQMRISAILSLRLQGFSLRQIGESQSPPCSAQAIFKAIKRAMRDMLIEPFAAIRTLELARLDELLASIYAQALAGDVSAIDRCLAISAHRARLTGLDIQPTRFGAGADASPTVRVEVVGDPELSRAESAVRLRLGETPRHLG